MAVVSYIVVTATKPGTPPPKVEKRTDDSRVFQIDCQPILADGEIIYGKVKEVKSTNSVIKVSELKSKLGHLVRFRVEGGPDTTLPHEEYLIVLKVSTSSGNELAIPVTVKAYSI
jgi:hypothetical protein